jgi:hypothetical protein
MSSENAAKLLEEMVQMDTAMACKGFVRLAVDSAYEFKSDHDDLQKPGGMLSHRESSANHSKNMHRGATQLLEKMGMLLNLLSHIVCVSPPRLT